MPVLTPDQIERKVEQLAGRGLAAGASYLAQRLKEKISVPAPRRRVIAGPRSKARVPGTPYYVATVRATPGAPPRKLSGNLRNRVMFRQRDVLAWQVGVFNIVYGRPLEVWMNHPYIWPTLQEELGNLDRIIGQEFRFSQSV